MASVSDEKNDDQKNDTSSDTSDKKVAGDSPKESEEKVTSTDDLRRHLNNDPEELPEATTDNVDTAPGGADASVTESDTGKSDETELLTRDQPLSAQQDEAEVPDAIQEVDGTDEATGGDSSDTPDDSNVAGEEAPDEPSA